MKVGQSVKYCDPDDGTVREATVVEIVGYGKSRAKMLNLHLSESDEVTSVSHGQDALEGEPFWLLPDEPLPDEWDVVEQPDPEADVMELSLDEEEF